MRLSSQNVNYQGFKDSQAFCLGVFFILTDCLSAKMREKIEKGKIPFQIAEYSPPSGEKLNLSINVRQCQFYSLLNAKVTCFKIKNKM